jgi:hypothetical protein
MNAMTWWDHETQSVWSQPWGRGIEGEYKGVELFLLPSQVTTWQEWKTSFPDTLVMTNHQNNITTFRRQSFDPDFVLGILLVDAGRAYYYEDVRALGVVNDEFADTPIVVWASESSLNAFVRIVGTRELSFVVDQGEVKDEQTGSVWNLALGRASAGELKGEVLQRIPGLTSFDWAWVDFFPRSEFFEPP